MFWYTCNSILVNRNTLSANLQMECIELPSDIQLNNMIISLHQTFINPPLTGEKRPLLASQSHLIPVIAVRQYIHL